MTTDSGERKIEFYRTESGRELHVWGTIPKRDPAYTQELAIGDPAVFVSVDAMHQGPHGGGPVIAIVELDE